MNKNGEQGYLGSRAKKAFSTYGGILIVLFLFILLFALTTNTFFRKDNLILILRQAAISCLTAFGVTIVLIAGSIDLSVGSVYGISGIIAGMLFVRMHAPIWLLFVVAIALGALIGLFNGLVVTKTSIPAFIATLGVSYICRGAAYLISGGVVITVMDNAFNQIGMGSVLDIPLPIYYMVVVFIILGLLLNKTRTGRYIYARGSNPLAARFAGIKSNKILVLAHVIVSVLAALTGVIGVARLFSATPGMGEGSEIDAIAAVVIGGTSMAGGKGSLIGTFVGSVIITVMGNGLNHLGVSPYWQQVVKGALIILAVGFDGFKRQAEMKRMQKIAVSAK